MPDENEDDDYIPPKVLAGTVIGIVLAIPVIGIGYTLAYKLGEWILSW